MNTTCHDLQWMAPTGDFTLPDNLAQMIPAGELIQHTLEAVQRFFWSTSLGGGTPVTSGAFNPRILLTLLSYSYATGVFSADSIAERCHREDVFRYLSMGMHYAADRIRLFRGQNSELVKRCLAFVIRRSCDIVARQDPTTMQVTNHEPVIDRKAATIFQTMVWSQREAERRFSKAVRLDYLMNAQSALTIRHSARTFY